MRCLLSDLVRAWISSAATVVVAIVYVLIVGLPEGRSWLSEYVVIAVVAFLAAYIGLILAAFTLMPFPQVAEWVKDQKATFPGRYVVMNQPGGGLALYFSVLALVMSLLVLPRTESLANLLSPNALTGLVAGLVLLSWLAVAVTQSLDYLASAAGRERQVVGDSTSGNDSYPGRVRVQYDDPGVGGRGAE